MKCSITIQPGSPVIESWLLSLGSTRCKVCNRWNSKFKQERWGNHKNQKIIKANKWKACCFSDLENQAEKGIIPLAPAPVKNSE